MRPGQGDQGGPVYVGLFPVLPGEKPVPAGGGSRADQSRGPHGGTFSINPAETGECRHAVPGTASAPTLAGRSDRMARVPDAIPNKLGDQEEPAGRRLRPPAFNLRVC